MARRQAAGRPRISEGEVAEMLRLKRQGLSILEIAKATGYHRQTVSTYLKERKVDALSEEVRKQVLVEELRQHYQDLANLVPDILRRQIDASRSQAAGVPFSALGGQRPISVAGLLGLPGPGSSGHIVSEWARMYEPSPKDRHLAQALREHTKNSDLWDEWDNWRDEVEDYESAGRKLLQWIGERIELERAKLIDPEYTDQVLRWLFGNILLKASGGEFEALELSGQELTSPGVTEPVARGADRDKLAALRDWLVKLLEEAQGLPEWAELKSSASQMMDKQAKLTGMVQRIDAAIEGVALMRAFPGRCHLCPV